MLIKMPVILTILLTVGFVMIFPASGATPKTSCAQKDGKSCYGHIEAMLAAGKKEEAKKVATDACLAEGNSYACIARLTFFDPADETKLLKQICSSQKSACVQSLQIYGYKMNLPAMAALAETLCSLGDSKACKQEAEFKKKHAAYEQAGRELLKQSAVQIARIRKEQRGKPVDYDLAKVGWGDMEKEIGSKKPLGKRIRFPVSKCGVFLPAFNRQKDKFGPIVECSDASPRVWYKIVVDETEAKTLPEIHSMRFPRQLWYTGTIVELRPTGVVDALVIITDGVPGESR